MINLTIYSTDGIRIKVECQIGSGEDSFVHYREFDIHNSLYGIYNVESTLDGYTVNVINKQSHEIFCSKFINDAMKLFIVEADMKIEVK
tara:strand:- start:11666 stop:11932 length:267 start_codon:yes stop_codon:yes gene_type:complete